MQDKFTVVVIGDEAVGKSALIIRLCLDHFPESHAPTADDTIRKPAVIDNKSCLVNIIDTAGRDEYASQLEEWMSHGDAFLLAYDVTSRASFDHVIKYYNQVRRMKLGRGLAKLSSGQMLFRSPHGVSMVLVGNKIDMAESREVSTEEGRRRAASLGCGYAETSAKENVNVEEPFVMAVRWLRQRRRPDSGDDEHAKKSGCSGLVGKPSRRSKCTIL
ncbi:ras-like protein Ras1 [Aspergillus campestris IBT 28561]|uniref:Ras-like protein Ras1 n=1 Tax=Aspergillus campestris (strain IBT 28561) TaxID=1392248 RepID=A0A2I1CTL8_ASPC2|nr:ras-like protein Ras1 [Aspergillus campestris IBT 28561]PKY00973.1 ras-like protein Ras1 [Aspergillus campestris IBT 28561]